MRLGCFPLEQSEPPGTDPLTRRSGFCLSGFTQKHDTGSRSRPDWAESRPAFWEWCKTKAASLPVKVTQFQLVKEAWRLFPVSNAQNPVNNMAAVTALTAAANQSADPQARVSGFSWCYHQEYLQFDIWWITSQRFLQRRIGATVLWRNRSKFLPKRSEILEIFSRNIPRIFDFSILVWKVKNLQEETLKFWE